MEQKEEEKDDGLTFEQACGKARNITTMTEQQKGECYGLYKQATVGNVQGNYFTDILPASKRPKIQKSV